MIKFMSSCVPFGFELFHASSWPLLLGRVQRPTSSAATWCVGRPDDRDRGRGSAVVGPGPAAEGAESVVRELRELQVPWNPLSQ